MMVSVLPIAVDVGQGLLDGRGLQLHFGARLVASTWVFYWDRLALVLSIGILGLGSGLAFTMGHMKLGRLMLGLFFSCAVFLIASNPAYSVHLSPAIFWIALTIILIPTAEDGIDQLAYGFFFITLFAQIFFLASDPTEWISILESWLCAAHAIGLFIYMCCLPMFRLRHLASRTFCTLSCLSIFMVFFSAIGHIYLRHLSIQETFSAFLLLLSFYRNMRRLKLPSVLSQEPPLRIRRVLVSLGLLVAVWLQQLFIHSLASKDLRFFPWNASLPFTNLVTCSMTSLQQNEGANTLHHVSPNFGFLSECRLERMTRESIFNCAELGIETNTLNAYVVAISRRSLFLFSNTDSCGNPDLYRIVSTQSNSLLRNKATKLRLPITPALNATKLNESVDHVAVQTAGNVTAFSKDAKPIWTVFNESWWTESPEVRISNDQLMIALDRSENPSCGWTLVIDLRTSRLTDLTYFAEPRCSAVTN